MNELTAQQTTPARQLATLPQETIWLANFISPNTKKTYSQAVREFVSFHDIRSAEELQLIDQVHIITWRDSLLAQGIASRTINARISALSSLFKHLCEKQITKRNPTTGVKRPRINTSEVQAPLLTSQHVRAMLDRPDTATLKGLRDRAILHTLFYTGCRISEVCSLKVKDFYEDAGYRVLNFTIKGGKNNKIAIHHELQIALRQYFAIADHGNEPDAPLMLPVQRYHLRKPLSRIQVHNIFHQYAEMAGLPKGVRPHSARATFITGALENGASIEAVQKSVGHSKINTTQMYDKRTFNHRESASFSVRW